MAARFEDIQARIFVDDEEKVLLKASDLSFETQVRHESVKYQGEKVPTKDSTYEGETFSLTLEQPEGSVVDVNDVFDSFVQGVKERTAAGKVRAVLSYQVPGEARRRAYRYLNCQLNVTTRSASGGKLIHTLRAEAENRERIQ